MIGVRFAVLHKPPHTHPIHTHMPWAMGWWWFCLNVLWMETIVCTKWALRAAVWMDELLNERNVESEDCVVLTANAFAVRPLNRNEAVCFSSASYVSDVRLLCPTLASRTKIMHSRTHYIWPSGVRRHMMENNQRTAKKTRREKKRTKWKRNLCRWLLAMGERGYVHVWP